MFEVGGRLEHDEAFVRLGQIDASPIHPPNNLFEVGFRISPVK